MAWTYDPSNLDTATSGGRLNVVRLLVGDTDTNDQQLDNQEIDFALAQSGDNVYFAAAWSARAVAGKYARKINTELDAALRADYSDLSGQYSKLAENLEFQGKKSSAGVGIKAGGISKAVVQNVRQNTDRITPTFRRDRFRNPPSYSGDDYGSDFE